MQIEYSDEEVQGLQNTQANDDKSQLLLENQLLREEMSKLQEEVSCLRDHERVHQVDEEHVQVLEQQIQITKEEFQQERTDRLKAEARVTELETEVDLIRRQLDQFQMSHMARLRAQRENALNYYRNQHHNSNGQGASGSMARGVVVADALDDDDEETDSEEDQIDSPHFGTSLQAHIASGTSGTSAEHEPEHFLFSITEDGQSISIHKNSYALPHATY